MPAAGWVLVGWQAGFVWPGDAASEEVGLLTSFPGEAALSIYRKMATIRMAEDRIIRGLSSGEFAHSYYPVRGQEAIAATLGEVLRPDDHLSSTYRCFADIVAKGTPLREIIAEQQGKATGTSKGKGGPMHISDPRSGLMVTTGIVGAGLPVAIGLALAAQLDRSDRVAVASFGDGATSIGATHEAMNLAALWGLPWCSCVRTICLANTPRCGLHLDGTAIGPGRGEGCEG